MGNWWGSAIRTRRAWTTTITSTPNATTHPTVPTYHPADFERMLVEQQVDTVIVTSVDRTHHTYINRAMEQGCDVITEKPMTTDAQTCQAILDVQRRTGKQVTVTFNARYIPRHEQVKELLQTGIIGKVLSVHFEWLLDTRHGADYFRRWHRERENSGGLLVHKATHHFDLVNWWLDAAPQTVFGWGGLRFYGETNAHEHGIGRPYVRAHGSAEAQNDPWALDLDTQEDLRGLYLNAEHEDGYIRDQNVFGAGITIDDDMGLVVRYETGATMTYHLTAYSPWEGYRIVFNGTGGRLEVEVVETTAHHDDAFAAPPHPDAQPIELEPGTHILVRPLWSRPYTLPVRTSEGTHAGGDTRMLDDIFGVAAPDPLHRAAGIRDGALSILTGIAANTSFESGSPTHIEDLVRF